MFPVTELIYFNKLFKNLFFNTFLKCIWKSTSSYHGPGSSVGIASELRAGRSGTESRWGRDFSPFQTGPGAHSPSCKMGTGCFSGVNSGRCVLLATHPLLVPRSWKSRPITLPTLWACNGITLPLPLLHLIGGISQSFSNNQYQMDDLKSAW